MKFDLVRPCKNCPFRTDCLKGWLSHRILTLSAEIFEQNKTFTCHETLKYDTNGRARKSKDKNQHCAGALILIEKTKTANSMVQIAERLGLYNPGNLDMESPIFKSIGDFIDHHRNDK